MIELVKKRVSPVICEPFELVDIEYEKKANNSILRILVDKKGGISLEDTVYLSEKISPLLDQMDPDPFPESYMLEVASPGLERPLKTKEAIKQAVGEYVHIGLYQAIDKKKVIEGVLVCVEEDTLTVSYQEKNREQLIHIPYHLVAKARLAVTL